MRLSLIKWDKRSRDFSSNTLTEHYQNKPIPAPSTQQATPTPTSAPTPNVADKGSETQRLARAAEVRDYLKQHNIPAYVVANGNTLRVQYTTSSGDLLPETFGIFCKQHNISGLISSGFETLQLEAKDSSGVTQSKIFRLNECEQ